MSQRAANSTGVVRPRESRRTLLGVAAAGAGALLAGCATSTKTRTTPAVAQPGSEGGQGDLGIVNFALTLEYVESDFYHRALSSGSLGGYQLDLFERISSDEDAHVAALEHAARQLGQPIARPTTQFSIQDSHQALLVAATLESTGAAAYLGQVDKIVSVDVLKTALSIHSVEGRHAAEIERLLGRDFTPDGPFASALSSEQVMERISPYIA